MWPVPNRRWTMRMNWHDLLFMHWKVNHDSLARLLPKGVEIDTFDGSPWIGIVPFRMTGVAPRYFPNIPFVSSFPELNVRTYVTVGGKPGVWFFCLEATNPIAVRVARKFFHLPYMDAKINLRRCESDDQCKWIGYDSTRSHRGEPAAKLKLEYRPIGSPFLAQPNTLESFLTARYCLYSSDPKGNIYRGEVDHAPWELRGAQAIIKNNTMTDWLNIDLPDEAPILHYAKKTSVVAWAIKKV
jgi:uncharacterized protein YqjF (DUF2071 family)